MFTRCVIHICHLSSPLTCFPQSGMCFLGNLQSEENVKILAAITLQSDFWIVVMKQLPAYPRALWDTWVHVIFFLCRSLKGLWEGTRLFMLDFLTARGLRYQDVGVWLKLWSCVYLTGTAGDHRCCTLHTACPAITPRETSEMLL